MRLFFDECISPNIARTLNKEGEHLVLHPRDFGGIGEADHTVLARCVDEDLVLVTANAIDFRKLVETRDIHPGLIIVPSLAAADSETIIRAAIGYLDGQGDPMDVMVNHVLEMSVDGHPTIFPLPAVGP